MSPVVAILLAVTVLIGIAVDVRLLAATAALAVRGLRAGCAGIARAARR